MSARIKELEQEVRLYNVNVSLLWTTHPHLIIVASCFWHANLRFILTKKGSIMSTRIKELEEEVMQRQFWVYYEPRLYTLS